MKRFLNLRWASVLLVAVALIAVTTARVLDATAREEPPMEVDQLRERDGVPVEIIRATEAPLRLMRSFTGTARGIRSATLRAATGDQILEIPVRVGQRVEESQVLVRQSSRGSMSSLDQARAAWEQAQRTVDRFRPLHEEGPLSDHDWDEALTGLRVAEANLEAARKAIVLTSPIAGTVTDVLVTEGTYPDPGDPLVRVSDLSRTQLLLHVSPEQRREMELGQRAGIPGSEAEGSVTRIALQADPESRLLEVEITFPGSSGLLPGALSPVEILVLEREAVISLPSHALFDDSIWVLDGQDLAHRVPVTIGARTRDRVEVLSGVEAGDRVVVAGGTLLSEGVLARVVGG